MTSFKDNKNFHTYYQSVYELSCRQYNNGQLKEAEILVETALSSIPEYAKWAQNRVSLWVQLGRIQEMTAFLHNSSYDEALFSLNKALDLAKQIDADLQIADANDEIGNAMLHRFEHQQSGSLAEARNHFDTALKIYENYDHSIGVCKVLIHLGQTDEQEQQFERAVEHFSRAGSIAEDYQYQYELSFAIRHLGKAHQRNGDVDASYPLHKRSLGLRQQIGLKPFLPFSYITMGQLESARGNTETALEYLLTAYDIAVDINAPFAMMTSAQALYDFYKTTHNSKEMQEYFKIASDIAHSINHKNGLNWSNTHQP